jgi:hypothetical protein
MAMKIPASQAAALAAGAMLLSGCVHYSHRATDVVHDQDLTYDDYDGTVSFEPGEGADPAVPPVEVHEFDPELVAAQGGSRLIDGRTWLKASDAERNQLLLDAEKTFPSDAILVLVVATGEVWALGPNAGALIQTGAVKEWSGKDYDNLYEFYLAPSSLALTKGDFAALTEIGPLNGVTTPYFVHDIGPIGRTEIQSAHGFEVLAPMQWIGATPLQRAQELIVLDRYLEHLPQFQGAGNQPVFGVSIAWGMVYAIPERNYQNLIGWHSLQPWTAEQIGSLPYVSSGTDRPIRNLDNIRLNLETRL